MYKSVSACLGLKSILHLSPQGHIFNSQALIIYALKIYQQKEPEKIMPIHSA